MMENCLVLGDANWSMVLVDVPVVTKTMGAVVTIGLFQILYLC
jgi:hypothetical protein